MLSDLIGRKVSVWSVYGQGEHKDDGVLEACEGPILTLRCGDEYLYLVLYNVRLIKPADGGIRGAGYSDPYAR